MEAINTMWRWGLLIGVCSVFILSGAAWCQPAADVVEQVPQGVINWSRGLIQAVGTVTPQKPISEESADRQPALVEARHRAWQRLFDTVMQVRIQGDRRVRDLTGDNNIVVAKIQEMVKMARVLGQEYLSDGTVAVTVEMNLFGGFSQMVLPLEIKQVESLKTVGKTGSAAPRGANGSQAAREKIEPIPFSGLVIDARGSGCLPAIYPTVTDETGEEIYGAAFVSREFAVQQGMSGYATGLAAALADPRVAPRPMTVKGLRTLENNPSAIVVSNADGARIRGTPEHLIFFKTCDVVIVLD